MLNTLVSIGNDIAGRVIAGELALSLDHPLVLCAIMAAVAAASCAVLLDVVGIFLSVQQAPAESHDRPIRIFRRQPLQ